MSRKKWIVLFAVFVTAAPLRSQSKSDLTAFVKTQIANLTRPSRHWDSTYVFQPAFRWSSGFDCTLIGTGVSLTNDVTLTDFSTEEEQQVHAILENRMQGYLHRKIGAFIGYGSLRLGYGVSVGAKSPGHNRYYSLSLTRPAFGGSVQYYKIYGYMDANLSIDGLDTPFDFTSDYPGLMRDISLDAYYVFNNKRFVYKALNGNRLQQRRTAGSWMLVGRYTQGDLALNQEDEIFVQMTSGLGRFETRQASFGGGYSVNWVPVHRDPRESGSMMGLRNLTVNATLLPMLSFYNRIIAENYTESAGKRTASFNSTVVPFITALGGIGYSWDRSSITAVAEYHRFGFKGLTNTSWEDDGMLRAEIDTRARFYDWTARIQYCVRF